MFVWDTSTRTLWKHNVSDHYIGEDIKTGRPVTPVRKTFIFILSFCTFLFSG